MAEEHDCNQKENIKKLFDFHDEKMVKLHDMEVRQVEIQGDVKHIKTRIDNGMSHTLADIHKKLNALEPTIGHNSEVVRKIEGLGWTISTTIIFVVLGLIVWAVAHGFKPPL